MSVLTQLSESALSVAAHLIESLMMSIQRLITRRTLLKMHFH